MLSIRPSALPGYLSCKRRGSVAFFYKEITEAGYTINPAGVSIAAKQGQALHAGAAEMLRQVQNSSGYLTREEIEQAVEHAIFTLDEDLLTSSDVIFDATTKDDDIARDQLRQMLYAGVPIWQTLEPKLIEHKFEPVIYSPLGEQAIPISVEGTLDVLDNRRRLFDHKGGQDVPFAHAQIGLYSLLCKSYGITVDETGLIYIPRSRGAQKPAEMIRFDIEECESLAWETMRSIQYDYERWLEEGKPTVFAPDATCRYCTPNYCRAYNTPWCKVGVEVHG